MLLKVKTLFNKNEIDAMDDLRCYESQEELAKKEINSDEKDMYLNDESSWDISLNDWFMEQLKHKIYRVDINKNKALYIFDGVDDEIYCDTEELINKIFDNYDIQDSNSFDELIVKIQDQFYQKKLSHEKKELLKKIHVYDDLYDLAEEYYTEEYLEEYISHFSNLQHKFEVWFFDNDPRCYQCHGLYLFIDLDKQFIPIENLKIKKQIKELFEEYNIYSIEEIEDLKQQNKIGVDE